jgi:hypothetical protein
LDCGPTLQRVEPFSVMTDLMSFVVPMPRPCMAVSRRDRYASGVPPVFVTGAASSLRAFRDPLSLGRCGSRPILITARYQQF